MNILNNTGLWLVCLGWIELFVIHYVLTPIPIWLRFFPVFFVLGWIILALILSVCVSIIEVLDKED